MPQSLCHLCYHNNYCYLSYAVEHLSDSQIAQFHNIAGSNSFQNLLLHYTRPAYSISLLSDQNLSKIVTLQEKEKTYFMFNVSQWNKTFFHTILSHFFWSVHHEIYTQCKEHTGASKLSKPEKWQTWRYEVLFRQQRYVKEKEWTSVVLQCLETSYWDWNARTERLKYWFCTV